MNNPYYDITSRIPEPPKWYDEHAVPRYCAFVPGRQANIYADRVALVLIACQNCRREFVVCMSEGLLDRANAEYSAIETEIRNGFLHYGDPPNADCCPGGPSMNCIDVWVLEFWRRVDGEWVRDPSLEVGLEHEHE